jgi:hypothetical protein
MVNSMLNLLALLSPGYFQSINTWMPGSKEVIIINDVNMMLSVLIIVNHPL